MICPQCKTRNYCPCEGCAKRVAQGDWEVKGVHWVRVGDHDEACGKCGFTMNMCLWMELEIETARADKDGGMYIPDYRTDLMDYLNEMAEKKVPLPWASHIEGIDEPVAWHFMGHEGRYDS